MHRSPPSEPGGTGSAYLEAYLADRAQRGRGGGVAPAEWAAADHRHRRAAAPGPPVGAGRRLARTAGIGA
jgi:hypothetical protein